MLDPIMINLLKKALFEVILICLLTGTLGIFVVNYKMAFLSDAISHSAFTGVALGLIAGIDPLITLVIFGVGIGLLVIFFTKRTGMSYDTIIGVFFSFSVSLGIVIISSTRGLFRNFHTFLYGDILLITNRDILLTLAITLITLIFLTLNFNKLTLIGIDEDYASNQVKGVSLLKYILSFLLGITVTLSIKTIGILLVTALLVVPSAGARTISRSIREMFIFSILISLISGFGGIALSMKINSSTGASIVIIACMIFLFCSLYGTVLNYSRSRG